MASKHLDLLKTPALLDDNNKGRAFFKITKPCFFVLAEDSGKIASLKKLNGKIPRNRQMRSKSIYK